MTPEPCPTCKGKCCCRVENGLPIPHSVATLYIRHVCPDCDDGTHEICSEPEPFVPQRTAEDERAAVVAWLRTQRLYCTDSTGTPNAVSATYAHAADDIERGEHRREEER